MEQNRNPTTSPKEEKVKQPLTEEQRQRRRKMIVYPLMGLLFAGSMWLIFSPSDKEKEEAQQGMGFNTEMPMPEDKGIISDKRTAYEQARLEESQRERNRSMGDLASLFKEREEDSEEYSLISPEAEAPARRSYGGGGSSRPRQTIESSQAAYQDINRTLGSFYETQKEDPEKEELRERIEELEAMMEQQTGGGSSYDEQVALLEKSYELAAKYMPSGQNGQIQANLQHNAPEYAGLDNQNIGNKAPAMPVGQVAEQVVSTLAQHVSDTAFISSMSKERNFGFHTAIGSSQSIAKNTIAACVHGDQTLTDGQSVRLRLLEAMRVAGRFIPKNTVVVGTTRVQGERLGINISSLEFQGTIIPVELSIYDSDGQEGINIPNSMELSAVKEVAANMGSSLGSSINISTDAGAQLASDLGKGLIQGTSQYIAKKMRTVKVHLKSGYRVMLYQPED